MSKEQQIEEIATTISNSCERHGLDLRECEIDLIALDIAEQGYRKLHDDVLLLDNDGYTLIAVNKPIQVIKNEAVKEFAEKLKKEFRMYDIKWLVDKKIDELLKE